MKLHFPEIVFPASHYIPGQGGKCEGVHGHTYFVRDLTFDFGSTTELNKTGMIVDFGIIKGYFKDEWDHKNIIPEHHLEIWREHYARLEMPDNLKPLQFTTAEWVAKVMKADLIGLLLCCDNIHSFTVNFALYEGPKQDVMV